MSHPVTTRGTTVPSAPAPFSRARRYLLAGSLGVVATFGAPACNVLLEPAAVMMGLAWNATWIHGLHLGYRTPPHVTRTHTRTRTRTHTHSFTAAACAQMLLWLAGLALHGSADAAT